MRLVPRLRRIALTGPAAAVLLVFCTFSPVARADQATLETLLTDPTASISIGSLTFNHFTLDTFGLGQGPFPSDVTVSGITLNGESGLRFNGQYGPGLRIFNLITFDVTAADSSSPLDDATVAFDALPLPNNDPGQASVESLIYRPPFPLFDTISHLLVCTEGSTNPGPCQGQNKFIDHAPFMEQLGPPGLVELSSARVQVEISVDLGASIFDPVDSIVKIGQVDITFSQVPEPSTFILFMTGLAALAWKRKTSSDPRGSRKAKSRFTQIAGP